MEYIVIEKFLHQNETERRAALAQLLRLIIIVGGRQKRD